MSGRHPSAMRPADKRGDPYVDDYLSRYGLDSEQVYTIRGFPGHEAANEGRLSVQRSARRQNLGPSVWVADDAGERCGPRSDACGGLDAPHQVRFRLWSKDRAREYVFRESGGDPANLKFNPWAGRGRKFSDSGHA